MVATWKWTQTCWTVIIFHSVYSSLQKTDVRETRQCTHFSMILYPLISFMEDNHFYKRNNAF